MTLFVFELEDVDPSVPEVPVVADVVGVVSCWPWVSSVNELPLPSEADMAAGAPKAANASSSATHTEHAAARRAGDMGRVLGIERAYRLRALAQTIAGAGLHAGIQAPARRWPKP